MVFASDEEADRALWVQAIYRATGQSHRPVPPPTTAHQAGKPGSGPQSKTQGINGDYDDDGYDDDDDDDDDDEDDDDDDDDDNDDDDDDEVICP